MYGRLYTHYKFAIDEVDTYARRTSDAIVSTGGEVLIPASGETAEEIGRASAVTKAGIILGGDLNILKPRNLIDSLFLALVISNGETKMRLSKKAQGKSVVHIHNSDIKTIVLHYPQLEEQHHIALLFSKVDMLIAAQERKLDLLRQKKAYYLQAIFSQHLRFKGFTEPWRQRKFSDILVVSAIRGSKGDVAKKLTVKLWGKGIVSKQIIGSPETQYYIRHAGQLMYGKLDFLHAAFGIVPSELDGYESTADSPAFDIDSKVNPYFILNNCLRKNLYLIQGSRANGSRKAKRIHEEVFLSMTIEIPSREEQDRIVNLVRILDRNIFYQEQKLETLKKKKEYYLQSIFV